MVRSKSLSLLGFCGTILTEVMEGGLLIRILDLNSTSFSFSQEKFKKKEVRRAQMATALMKEYNLLYLILFNEWIEM